MSLHYKDQILQACLYELMDLPICSESHTHHLNSLGKLSSF